MVRSTSAAARSDDPRRALVFHDRPSVVDLVGLPLNHGLFKVRAADNLVEAEAILSEWHPRIAVVDMDHDDSAAFLEWLGVDFIADSNVVARHVRSLRTKLRCDHRHPRFIATVPGRGYRFIPTSSNSGWAGGPEHVLDVVPERPRSDR